jgi:hypothetical protein
MKEAAVVLGAVVGLAVAAKSKLFVAAAIAVLGFSSQAFAQSSTTSSCSDQIADLRQVERLNHQPTPEWQAQTYEGLMFSADLTQAEAKMRTATSMSAFWQFAVRSRICGDRQTWRIDS